MLELSHTPLNSVILRVSSFRPMSASWLPKQQWVIGRLFSYVSKKSSVFASTRHLCQCRQGNPVCCALHVWSSCMSVRVSRYTCAFAIFFFCCCVCVCALHVFHVCIYTSMYMNVDGTFDVCSHKSACMWIFMYVSTWHGFMHLFIHVSFMYSFMYASECKLWCACMYACVYIYMYKLYICMHA